MSNVSLISGRPFLLPERAIGGQIGYKMWHSSTVVSHARRALRADCLCMMCRRGAEKFNPFSTAEPFLNDLKKIQKI
jgi:hypothetical protein